MTSSCQSALDQHTDSHTLARAHVIDVLQWIARKLWGRKFSGWIRISFESVRDCCASTESPCEHEPDRTCFPR